MFCLVTFLVFINVDFLLKTNTTKKECYTNYYIRPEERVVEMGTVVADEGVVGAFDVTTVVGDSGIEGVVVLMGVV